MERFYYLYLKDALREREMSEAGIHQVEQKLPISQEKDRKLAVTFFFNALKFEQRKQDVIDITPDHIRPRLVELGFTLMGVSQLYNLQSMTNAVDREVLLGVLTTYFVTNEAMIPSGYRSDMKALWKANEVKRHGES